MSTAISPRQINDPLQICLLALPEITGGTFYGLYEVLSSVGTVWPELTGEGEGRPALAVQIVASTAEPFRCTGGVPIAPQRALDEIDTTDVVIVPDLSLPLTTDPQGRWPEAVTWLRTQYARGATLCSVCSGSVLLAETGLLDGHEATTHWAAANLLTTFYPAVILRPERVLVPVGAEHRIITSGGAASWEDLALYLIGRYCGGIEAVRTAKVFLLGDRSDGQLPYAALCRPKRHEDAAIARCQTWIAEHYTHGNPVAAMLQRSGLSERTFKRRFRAATGLSPLEYVQTLRIEEAKQLLETTNLPTDDIGTAVGYEDPAFFRRLFKRRTALTPSRYRRRFQPLRTGCQQARRSRHHGQQ